MVVYFIMNNTQKWFIVLAVGCISAIGMACLENDFKDIFDIVRYKSGGIAINWTGCVLSGMVCSSITGFFLFKDYKRGAG